MIKRLETTTDSMFDCKSSGSDQSEDKRNCHIYVTSILSITLVMFSLIQSTFSAVFSYLSDLCHSLLCLCYVSRMLCRNVCVVSNNVMSDECEFFQKITFSSEVLVLSDIRPLQRFSSTGFFVL